MAKKEQEDGQKRQALDRALRLMQPYTPAEAQAATAAELETVVTRFGQWLRSVERGNLSAQHALSDAEGRVLEQHKEPHGTALDTFSALFELYLPCRDQWQPHRAESICAVVADWLRSEHLKMMVAKTTATAVSINKVQPQLRVFNLDGNMPKQYPSGQVGGGGELG